MARLNSFLHMNSVFMFLMVPVLVIATVGQDDTTQSRSFNFVVGKPDQGHIPEPFYKTVEGTLQQKRDELIKRIGPNDIVMKFQRSKRMLDQVFHSYTETPGSRIRILFQEDRPTNNYLATFREYLSLMSKDMMDPGFGLFITSDIQPSSFPGLSGQSRLSHDLGHKLIFQPVVPDSDHVKLSKLKHIGQMIGNAILYKHFINVSFMPLFYKVLLNKEIKWSDVRSINPVMAQKLDTILSTDQSDPKKKLIWCRGGMNIRVTNENKEAYVQSEAAEFYNKQVKPSVEALLEGFEKVIKRNALAMFDENDLETLISGEKYIDLRKWKKYTRVSVLAKVVNRKVIRWFWECISEWEELMRLRLLVFVTGMSGLPIGGFKGAYGRRSAWFNIEYLHNEKDSLPYSDPYKNVLYLPKYSSMEVLKEKLEKAVQNLGNIYDIWQASATHLRYQFP